LFFSIPVLQSEGKKKKIGRNGDGGNNLKKRPTSDFAANAEQFPFHCLATGGKEKREERGGNAWKEASKGDSTNTKKIRGGFVEHAQKN